MTAGTRPALLLHLAGELGGYESEVAGKTLAVFVATHPGAWPEESPAHSNVRAARMALGVAVEILEDVTGADDPTRRSAGWAARLREVESQITEWIGDGGEAQATSRKGRGK